MQILCATTALLLVIVALALDEMSDGDVKFAEDLKSTDFLDEIDYDCGWRSFRVNKIYYEDEDDSNLNDGQTHWAYESYIYEYSGSLCQDNDEIIDPNFCEKSAYNGKVWLACGILGIFFYGLSIPIVWYQGKGSIIYVLLLGIGMLCLAVGSLNWMFNDKCEDVENWPQEDMSFDTSLGVSLILVFISVFCAVIAVLVSSIHLLSPVQQRRKEEQQQSEQPRIQSHVVQ